MKNNNFSFLGCLDNDEDFKQFSSRFRHRSQSTLFDSDVGRVYAEGRM